MKKKIYYKHLFFNKSLLPFKTIKVKEKMSENQTNPKATQGTIYEFKSWVNEKGEIETSGKIGKDFAPQILSFFKNLTYLLENKAKNMATLSRHFEKRNERRN